MSQTTQRSIWLVTAPGEKTKSFGTRDLASEYLNNFCKGGKIDEITLFDKVQETEEHSYNPDDPDDYSPRKKKPSKLGPYDMDY